MDTSRGFWASLWNLVCFLPFFSSLLLLGFIKGLHQFLHLVSISDSWINMCLKIEDFIFHFRYHYVSCNTCHSDNWNFWDNTTSLAYALFLHILLCFKVSFWSLNLFLTLIALQTHCILYWMPSYLQHKAIWSSFEAHNLHMFSCCLNFMATDWPCLQRSVRGSIRPLLPDSCHFSGSRRREEQQVISLHLCMQLFLS